MSSKGHQTHRHPDDWDEPVEIPEINHDISAILVPFDGSAGSERGLAYAEMVARITNAEISVLVAFDPPLTVRRRGILLVEQQRAELEEDAKELATEATEALIQRGSRAKAIIVRGDPVQAILEAIESDDPDLVVIGRRGSTRSKASCSDRSRCGWPATPPFRCCWAVAAPGRRPLAAGSAGRRGRACAAGGDARRRARLGPGARRVHEHRGREAAGVPELDGLHRAEHAAELHAGHRHRDHLRDVHVERRAAEAARAGEAGAPGRPARHDVRPDRPVGQLRAGVPRRRPDPEARPRPDPEPDNLGEEFRHEGFDPGNAYTVPWATGTTGIAYNHDEFDEPPGYEVFLDDKVRNKATILDETRDAYAVALFSLARARTRPTGPTSTTPPTGCST